MPAVTYRRHPAPSGVRLDRRRLILVVPEGIEGGPRPVRARGRAGQHACSSTSDAAIATGLHRSTARSSTTTGQVYVTYSGARGQQSSGLDVPRAADDGVREVFVTGVTNATSMAFDPQGRLHVSSRFDGTVCASTRRATAEVIASDLGVAMGLTFTADGVLYVGDRSGTIFRLGRTRRPHRVRLAAVQRRGLSPRVESAGRRAVRDRADAGDARRLVPGRPARRRVGGLSRVRAAAGTGDRHAGHGLCRRSARRRERDLSSPARPERAGLSHPGSWPDRRRPPSSRRLCRLDCGERVQD